jgi:hypothetical protein
LKSNTVDGAVTATCTILWGRNVYYKFTCMLIKKVDGLSKNDVKKDCSVSQGSGPGAIMFRSMATWPRLVTVPSEPVKAAVVLFQNGLIII